MGKSMYISVYLLDVPFSADDAYTYLSPPMEGNLSPGMLVAVPFGKGNRRMNGLVTEVDTTKPDGEVKTILEVVSDEPLLTGEMLSLCFFMKEHCLCTMGDAFRAMIPSSAVSKTKEYYVVSEDMADEARVVLSREERGVYDTIALEGKITKKDLCLGNEETEKILQKLCRKGYVKKEAESTRGGTNRKYVTYYSLALPEEETAALIENEKAMRSRGQREILRALLSAEDRLSPTELFSLSRENATPAMVKALVNKGFIKEEKEEVYRNPFLSSGIVQGKTVLSGEQREAFQRLKELSNENEPRAALLYGVTGSGKTAVIRAMIEETLSAGRGAIILVPEISLTPQTVQIFVGCFGERCAVIHSSLSQGERFDAFRRIREGKADVVIGTRSAIFAPMENLGLIVIDEEQEHTYKSDTDPKYSTHEVASFRCRENKALLILASATPSVISYYKAKAGNYELISLLHRYGDAVLPEVKVVDMKEELRSGNTSSLSGLLRGELLETSEKEQQSIVFINRRGYHSFLTCRQCGEVITCPKCSVSLTFHTRYAVENKGEDYLERHRKAGKLLCHYCGYVADVPEACPSCHNSKLAFMGGGTQRTEDELKELLPNDRIVRMDMDTTSGKFSHEEILDGFRQGKTDVLVGTQMVTKGHDFPKVTLVGVVNADAAMYQDDYRAREKTFDMVTQVIGRAGRGKDPGEAVVQTMNPRNDIISLAAAQDYPGFYEREIVIRKKLTFPPFCDLALLTLTSEDEVEIQKVGLTLLSNLKKTLETEEYHSVPMMIFGPFEAPVYKVQNKYRMRLVLKCRLNRQSRRLFADLLRDFGRTYGKKVTLGIDFNPSSV